MTRGVRTTRLAGLVGAVVLLGGVALSAVVGVSAQAPATPTPASNVGGPAGVPSARFFGSVTGANGAPVVSGTTVTATIGGVACGVGSVTGTTYIVDVQAISGCTAPGATVSFAIGGQPATQTGTLPNVEGTAVTLNLTVAVATPTPAPATATTVPPPPPPPPPTTAPATASPTPAASPVTQQTTQQTAKPVVVTAQKPVAVTAQKPGATTTYPAARVSLPNTGAGANDQTGTASVALLGILLGALALGGTGLVAYRRSR